VLDTVKVMNWSPIAVRDSCNNGSCA
jgi:hypothetical protein